MKSNDIELGKASPSIGASASGVGTPADAAAPLPLLLHEISVRRFRSLYDVGPVRIQRGLTAVAGENDGGKSTLIDAIAFLLGSYKVDDGDYYCGNPDGGRLEVEGLFYGIDDSRREHPVRIRATPDDVGRSVTEILGRVHPAFGARPEDLSLVQLRGCMVDADIAVPGGREKAPVVEAAKAWLVARPDEEWDACWRPLSREEASRMPEFTRFSASTSTSPTEAVRAIVAREAKRLLGEDAYSPNLTDIVRRLSTDVEPGLERIRAKIKAYCPELESVDVDATFDFTSPKLNLQIRVLREGNRIDLDKAGEGRRRRVTLAIHEANLRSLEQEIAAGRPPARSEFLAYDEPDTHLDYMAQRTLFDILDGQARLPHVQALAATHSMSFLDRVSPQALLHLRLGEDLRTEVRMLSGEAHEEELDFLDDLCEGLGLRNSRLLDGRCFLVVEGETEEAAIPVLFRMVTGQSLSAAGITLFNTKGSAAVRRIVEVIARDWGRRVVLLVDSDTRKSQGGRIDDRWLATIGLAEGAGAYFVGDKEFEDAFGDDVWLRALLADLPILEDVGDENWTLKDMQMLRNLADKYSDRMCELVRKRRRTRVSKTDLGLALAHACRDGDGIPEVLRDCLEFAHVVASGRAAADGNLPDERLSA